MREFTSPARFTVPDDASAVDTVFTRASAAPASVAFRRLVDGAWSDVTAEAFAAEVIAVAKGFVAAGVQQGERVALMSATRYEWSVIDYAIWASGGVTVPIYETSSAGQVEWILSDAAPVLLVAAVERRRLADVVGSEVKG